MKIEISLDCPKYIAQFDKIWLATNRDEIALDNTCMSALSLTEWTACRRNMATNDATAGASSKIFFYVVPPKVLSSNQKTNNEKSWQEGYSRLNIIIPLERNSQHYLYVILVPLGLIVISVLISFIDENENYGFMSSLLLAVITMKHTFSGMLPKLSYLTTLDKIFMWSYIYVFLGFLSLLLIDSKNKNVGSNDIRLDTNITFPLDENVTFPRQYGNFSLYFTKTEDKVETGNFLVTLIVKCFDSIINWDAWLNENVKPFEWIYNFIVNDIGIGSEDLFYASYVIFYAYWPTYVLHNGDIYKISPSETCSWYSKGLREMSDNAWKQMQMSRNVLPKKKLKLKINTPQGWLKLIELSFIWLGSFIKNICNLFENQWIREQFSCIVRLELTTFLKNFTRVMPIFVWQIPFLGFCMSRIFLGWDLDAMIPSFYFNFVVYCICGAFRARFHTRYVDGKIHLSGFDVTSTDKDNEQREGSGWAIFIINVWKFHLPEIFSVCFFLYLLESLIIYSYFKYIFGDFNPRIVLSIVYIIFLSFVHIMIDMMEHRIAFDEHLEKLEKESNDEYDKNANVYEHFGLNKN